MNNTKGWVKLPRAIMDDPSYLSGNVTEVMAWIDLILMATYESTSVYVRGHRYDIERGQLIVSIRELSSRWRWGTHHVINFLKSAENIHQRRHRGRSNCIRIRNRINIRLIH